MSIKRCSYLTGLDFANHYARVGAFRGSFPAGFMVSALLRFKNPFCGDGQTVRIPILNNFAPTAPFIGDGAGWQLLWQSEDLDDALLRPRYANGAGTIADAFPGFPGLRLLTNATLSCDTMLIHWFMGGASFVAPDTSSLYVNGNLIAAAGVGPGYMPADAANPFRVGAGLFDDNTQLGGGSMALSGFAYFDGVSQDNVVINDLVKRHWDAVQEAEDMVLGPLPANTSVFSVRQRLRTVSDGESDPWVASNGPVTQLDRVGTASLKTFASRPRFFDEAWEVGGA